MDLWNLIVRFFQGGGDFMYPIAIVFVVGLAIAIERYIYLAHMAARNRGLWNEIVPLLSQGNFRQVAQATSKSDSAIGHILNYGLARVQSARRRDDIEKAMEESLMEVVPRLEKRTHYIATFANVITLVGLLGRPSEMTSLGRKARQHVRRNFLTDRHLIDYGRLLEHVVEG